MSSGSRRTGKCAEERTTDDRPLGSHHQPRGDGFSAAIFLNHHLRPRARPHLANRRAPSHRGARCSRRLQQRLLHGGVIAGQARELMLCAGNKFAMFYPVAHDIRVDPVEVVPSGSGQAIGDSEGLHFRVAPRQHHLAAHAVLELPLVLDDQNFGAVFRHVFGQGCAAQAAAGDGHIVCCRHA